MENPIPQNSSVMATGSANEGLFWPSPNERVTQENIKKTQTPLISPFSDSKIPRSISECKIKIHTGNKKDSVNTSVYESFSIDESKYDSFDDSLNEAHISPKKINASNFLSEQVNVTVRKVHDRQKTKGSYLCDSLEDICSLVSNVDHFSTSDEIENLNNILEKHGICEDSLRNDVFHDKRNASLNEQYFDEDSLAILEVEKPFDDSLEDVDVVSCVDSLMVLGNSIGDSDVDKLVAENCGAARNTFETSVHIIYENAPISSDESFQTAENFNSNKNSLSLSDGRISRDSLEEIHDISEIASSEKSLNMPSKPSCGGNVFSTENSDLKSFDKDVLPEVMRTDELSPTFPNRLSNTESERASSVVNSCYFYDTFCMDDSSCITSDDVMNKKDSLDDKQSSEKVMDEDPDYQSKDNLNLMNEVTENYTEPTKEQFPIQSHFQDIKKNLTTDTDISSVKCFQNTSTDIIDKICLKTENETSQSTVVIDELSVHDTLNKNELTFQMDKSIISKVEDSETNQTEDVIHISTSKYDCNQSDPKYTDGSKNNRDINVQSAQDFKLDEFKDKSKVTDICLTLNNSPQLTFAVESSKKVNEFSSGLVFSPRQRSVKKITSLGKIDKYNNSNTKCSYDNESIENSHHPDHDSDQMSLKLKVKPTSYKNCDSSMSILPVDQKVCNEAITPAENRNIDSKIEDETSILNNPIKKLNLSAKKEIDALEDIMTEAHKKIPTLAKIPDYKNSEDNGYSMLISSSKTYSDVKRTLHCAHLLQALDLYDHSHNFSDRGCVQSRDSIEPLNLCIRDKLFEKDNDILEGKENIPCVQKHKTHTDSKGVFIQTKNKQHTNENQDIKKHVGKPCLATKIPIRKADSPLSIPVNQKQIKQDSKLSPSGGKLKKVPIVKSVSVDSIGKTNPEVLSKKHHFCMIRNSICRVPKSLEKPNAKKFQNVESPVAKYIGNAKIHSPLKTTHQYDGNLISTLPSRATPKAAGNACVISEIPSTKKIGKRLKS